MYTKLDSLIVQAIKNGKHPLHDAPVGFEAQRIARGNEREERLVIDGRMTALKRIGHIAFDRRHAKWTTQF